MSSEPEDLSQLRYAAGVDQQAGALAWSQTDGVRRFWIVTSRRTQRWVLPKGGIDEGMTAPEAAAQEAFEEAGVIGNPALNEIGHYHVAKIRPPLIWTVQVALYPMLVTEVLEEWKELKQRERRLVTIDEAAELIIEQDIIALIRRELPTLPT